MTDRGEGGPVMSRYKNKQAYEWHDEAMANLTAWHEEARRLKQQLAMMEGEVHHYREAASSVGESDGHGWAVTTTHLSQQLATQTARVSGLREALEKVMAKIDDGTLVRNTAYDGDVMAFMRQNVELLTILKQAQQALAEAKEGGDACNPM